MPEDEGRNEQVPGHPKEASVTIYLVEELGDARLRCDQLVRYVTEAVRLIETSPHRDKFYETAGHLLHAAPLTLFKLQKALQAVALAANRIDYEELKVELRPEKVQQLERVLEDVRIRQINRHSEPLMNPQQVAAKLHQIAATTREFQLPQDEVVGLIAALERGDKKADESVPLADVLDKFADLLVTPHKEGEKPSRFRLAAVLRRMVGDVCVKGHLAALAVTATGCGKEGCDCDKEGGCDKQAVPPGIAGKAADWEVEAAAEVNVGRLEKFVRNIEENLKSMRTAIEKYKKDPGKYAPQLENVGTDATRIYTSTRGILRTLGRKLARFEEGEDADKDNDGVPDNIKDEKDKEEWKAENAKNKDKFKKDKKAEEEKQTKFEEGKPADPTKNMSEEEAAEWRANTEKHKDKFKKDKKAAGVKPGKKIKSQGETLTVKKVLSDKWVVAQNPRGNLVVVSLNDHTGKWDSLDWFKSDDEEGAYEKAKQRMRARKKATDEENRASEGSDPWKVTAALKPKDKKVVEAFQAKKALEGSLISTDGRKLTKNGMGGGTFAEWKGSKIVLDPNRPMVKNDEPIIHYMKKAIPKGDLADHPNLRSATEQKQTGFAEGEKADKDGDGVPDNIKDEKAKKDWKENTDEFGDKFKGKKGNMWEGAGLPPERVEALNETAKRNQQALDDWKV